MQNKNKLDLKNRPIGVFDSGMGGLTVLRELIAHLPNESFIYLGDTARLPYGTKSADTVRHYAEQMALILAESDIKLLVVACNTATAAALPYLQAKFPSLPVIGVVEPGVSAAMQVTKNNNIAVLATEATIASKIYDRTISKYNENAVVVSQPCGLFVALAEEGCLEDDIAMAVVTKYLRPVLNNPIKCDCILLGCTHFPVLEKMITQAVADKMVIINSAKATASSVALALNKLHLHADKDNASIQFLVTDLPERFIRIGQTFLGHEINPALVECVDVEVYRDNITYKIKPDAQAY